MEYEVRFYFLKNKLDEIVNKLKNIKELKVIDRCYEKTMQFDHPNESLSFYNKEVDGRFRIRVTKSETISKCKISWKRRLKDTTKNSINKEEEVELNIDYKEYDNLMFIINNVLHMENVESYERYRTCFINDDIEVSIDEYPFGIALEIENKSNKNPEEAINYYTNILGLNIKEAYRLSWDDKYTELCNEQNIKHYNHVTFDKEMPEIR